jgi:ABC-2 type transport system permease protein
VSGRADSRRPLPVGAAVLELARAALIRTVRGRALWVVLALAALPTLLGMILSQAEPGRDEETWRGVFSTCLFVLIVVPSVLVAASVADEIEDKTSAYLWSRALPRWTVVIGKLLGLAPLCALLLAGAAVVPFFAANLGAEVATARMIDGALGLAAAGAAGAAIAAMIALLVPRHAVAVTVGWMMLVDAPLGLLDARLHHISINYGARAIAGYADGGAASGAITLLVLATIATAVACWRIGRIE